MANEAIELVLSISLKPGSDGNVFATACIDHVLRIFDIRRNTPLGEYSSLLRQITFTILNNYTLTLFNDINKVMEMITSFSAFSLFPSVFEAKNQFCPLQSVMFSPVDSSLIAVAGSKGAQILDIRKDSTRFSEFIPFGAHCTTWTDPFIIHLYY